MATEYFDVFVSYRRSDFYLARLVKMLLQENGLKAFLDSDDIGHTHFDIIIKTAIKRAEHFILIITKDSLDRCSDESDWIRLEIEEALGGNKNIVIVKSEDFGNLSTKRVTKSIEKILTINAITYSHEYYDGFTQRLIKSVKPNDAKKVEHLSEAAPTEKYITRHAINEDVKSMTEFLNLHFEDNAEYDQICQWISIYNETFLIVADNISNEIVGLCKTLPLNKDACDLVEQEIITGTSINAENMTPTLSSAPGVWIGDLAVSGSKYQKGIILADHILPSLISNGFKGKIYARASKKEGYDLLMKYGFSIVNESLRVVHSRQPQRWQSFLHRVMVRNFF